MTKAILYGLLLFCTAPAFGATVTGNGASQQAFCTWESYAERPRLTAEAKELANQDAQRQCHQFAAIRQSEFSVASGCRHGMYGANDHYVVRASAQYSCGGNAVSDDSPRSCEEICRSYGADSMQCRLCIDDPW